jgi:hypothetical protein
MLQASALFILHWSGVGQLQAINIIGLSVSAAYLICSASILFFFIKWFVRIIDNIIERQQRIPDEILALEHPNSRRVRRSACVLSVRSHRNLSGMPGI